MLSTDSMGNRPRIDSCSRQATVLSKAGTVGMVGMADSGDGHCSLWTRRGSIGCSSESPSRAIAACSSYKPRPTTNSPNRGAFSLSRAASTRYVMVLHCSAAPRQKSTSMSHRWPTAAMDEVREAKDFWPAPPGTMERERSHEEPGCTLGTPDMKCITPWGDTYARWRLS